MNGLKCPSCNRMAEKPGDIWTCLWCPDRVCTWCYMEHTETHEAEHSPEVYKKRMTEKCGEPHPDPECEVTCQRAWGHKEDHGEAPPGDCTWPRT